MRAAAVGLTYAFVVLASLPAAGQAPLPAPAEPTAPRVGPTPAPPTAPDTESIDGQNPEGRTGEAQGSTRERTYGTETEASGGIEAGSGGTVRRNRAAAGGERGAEGAIPAEADAGGETGTGPSGGAQGSGTGSAGMGGGTGDGTASGTGGESGTGGVGGAGGAPAAGGETGGAERGGSDRSSGSPGSAGGGSSGSSGGSSGGGASRLDDDRRYRAALENTFLPELNRLSAEQKSELVEAHNEWRSAVGVAPLAWSDELAGIASGWAKTLGETKQCVMQHSAREARKGTGENLYWASARNWTDGRREVQNVRSRDVVDSWGRERKDFNYGKNRCQAGRMCGHYTQVVWRDTREVGCARRVCPDSTQVWVCNYRPAGNIVGRKPY